jgi:hypothetical protein
METVNKNELDSKGHKIEKIFMGVKSELGWSVVEVHSFVSGWRFCVLTGLSCVQIDVRGEELDHIAQIDAHQESWYPEPEHGDSHGEVGDDGWGFVSQVEVFFVVDVIGSHFPDEGIEGTFPSQSVVSFGLVFSDVLWSVPV